nr:unnamed protein product [Callosobruchus chinensis]
MSKVKSKDQKSKSQAATSGTHNTTVSFETTYPEPANPAGLPFQEWTDEFINSEKWDATGSTDLFKDPQPVQLPHGFKYTKWQRVQDAFPNSEIVIFKNLEGFPDLRSESDPILHSEFVRQFISSMETLIYLGNCSKLSVEYQSPSFLTSTEKKPWRPWFHIYSKCKAGKTHEHNPVVNKVGKYVVRLYWLGTWRRVIVDDFIPMLGKKVMLPSLSLPPEKPDTDDVNDRTTSIHFEVQPTPTQPKTPKSPKSTKSSKTAKETKHWPTVQIWPFLLSKALMKIASLTWTREQEIVDFDIVECLTGYVPLKIYTCSYDFDGVWKVCWDHCEHFDYIEESTKPVKGKKSPRDTKKKDAKPKEEPGTYKEKPGVKKLDCYMFASFREKTSGQNHHFLIDMTRDKPLIKPSKPEDYPLWKRYRWIDWAANKGFINPTEPHSPIRCFKVVDPFKEKYYIPPPAFEQKREEIPDRTETATQSVPDEDDAKSKADSQRTTKTKDSKASGKSRKKTELQFPDPTFWIDVEQVYEQLNYLIIYVKPSTAAVRIRVSDMTANHVMKDVRFHYFNRINECLGFAWKEIIQPRVISCHRNEPIYIISESTSDIQIVMHLSQTGYVEAMSEEVPLTEWSAAIEESSSECGLCLDTLLARVKAYKTKNQTEEEIKKSEEHEGNFIEHYSPFSSFVLGDMKWYRENQDTYLKLLTTYGSKSTVLYKKPGRHLFRLWILSESPYVLQILSNNHVIAGSWQEIVLLMSEESTVFLDNCEQYISRFDNLIRSFGKPEFGSQLLEFRTFYKPDCELKKNESNIIHNQFFQELYNLAASRVSKQDADLLKILFLAWAFPTRRIDYKESLQFCYNLFEEEKEFVPIMQKSAQLIQAFFLKVYNRSNYKKLYPSSKHHKKVLEGLKHLRQTLFSKENMIQTATYLYRMVLRSKAMDDICQKYSFYEDLWNVVTLHWFPDTIKVPEQEWFLICRQIFFINHCSLDVRISLFLEIDKYTARIINNDNQRDVRFYPNRIPAGRYTSNTNGYTLLCYGWSTTSKIVNYKLCFIVKKEPSENISFDPTPNKVSVLCGNYIPNTNNRICRYIFKKSSEQVLLTVRLTASYNDVKLKLILQDEEKIIAEETGQHNVLIPLALLGASERRFSKMYSRKVLSRRKTTSSTDTGLLKNDISEDFFIEAYVLDDSWPLDVNEWKVVRNLRSQMQFRPPEHERIDVRNWSQQYPNWSLEIIYNNLATIRKDTTREEQIRDMKAEWYELDPDRYDVSQEYREKYLEEHLQPNLNLTDELLQERHLIPEVFDEEILPPYDITQYMKDESEEVEDMRYEFREYKGEGSFDDEELLGIFGVRYGEIGGEGIEYEGQETEYENETLTRSNEPVEKEMTRKDKICKSTEDLQMDYQRELQRIKEYQHHHQDMQTALEEHIDKHFYRLNNVGEWFQDCKAQSADLMTEGCHLRQQYINKIVEEIAKKNTKGKKEKGKGKKGKKK